MHTQLYYYNTHFKSDINRARNVTQSPGLPQVVSNGRPDKAMPFRTDVVAGVSQDPPQTWTGRGADPLELRRGHARRGSCMLGGWPNVAAMGPLSQTWTIS